MASDVQRAQNALETSCDRIGLLATDWATWDEAYKYMAEGGQEFIDSNLTKETFAKQHLAVIGLFDLSGRLVAGRFYDAQTREFVPIPPEVLALLAPKTGLLADAGTSEGRQGVAMVGGRPMLTAIFPVLTSEHEGPARGTLLMASWLDAKTVEDLAAATVLDMRMLPLNTPGLPDPATAEAVSVLPAAENARTRIGLGLVRDLFGQPALWLEVTAERDFFNQGLGLIHSSMGLLALAGVVLLLVLLAFLERRLLRRLQIISALAGRIAKGETSLRLHLPGTDELSGLALDLNTMLDRLEAAKRSLAASENRYRTLFLGIGSATIVVGPDGAIELANPAFTRLVGLPREELEGRRRWTDFCPELAAPSDGALPLVIQDESAAIATVLRRGDGESRHVLLTMARLEGGPAAIVSLVDNTAAKLAEQELASISRNLEALVSARTEEAKAKTLELEAVNERLRELDRIKSSFLSSVSHELRTPLTSIRGFASIIERDLQRLVETSVARDLDENPRIRRIRTNLRIINEENRRLTGLINDFLDLSKIESGKMEWRDNAVDARDLAERAERATASLFDDGAVRLIVEVDSDTPRLFADGDRLLQVCINLLANARKFTDNGQVRLVIGLDADGDWSLRVEDTGHGIAPGDLDRIFDNFTQAAAGNQTGSIGGTGLGLSICRTIVAHYGGRIWAESNLGQGSVLTIKLPRKRLFVDPPVATKTSS
ncbi:MAG: CHASE4 domain-containing protein [Acidobacteriota bacterium]